MSSSNSPDRGDVELQSWNPTAVSIECDTRTCDARLSRDDDCHNHSDDASESDASSDDEIPFTDAAEHLLPETSSSQDQLRPETTSQPASTLQQYALPRPSGPPQNYSDLPLHTRICHHINKIFIGAMTLGGFIFGILQLKASNRANELAEEQIRLASKPTDDSAVDNTRHSNTLDKIRHPVVAVKRSVGRRVSTFKRNLDHKRRKIKGMMSKVARSVADLKDVDLEIGFGAAGATSVRNAAGMMRIAGRV